MRAQFKKKMGWRWAVYLELLRIMSSYLQANRMPSWETNCVEDWETKVELIVGETLREKMTLIG